MLECPLHKGYECSNYRCAEILGVQTEDFAQCSDCPISEKDYKEQTKKEQ